MSLRERVNQPKDTRPWYGELPVESLYTVGIAGEKFLRTLKEKGQFLGTKCDRCRQVYVPPKIYCERCLAKLDDWVKVGSCGTLESWTMVHVGLDGQKLKKPELVALVKLDGASTCIVHKLAGIPVEELHIGMRVCAVLKPKTKREGAITDILHFKPADR